jgi:tetrahydromethanopterin S-methyltransferase subunit B
MDPMQAKLANFEAFQIDTCDRLARIETRLDTFATKEDLKELKAELEKNLHGMTWKPIGSASLLVAIVYFIAKTVH